MNKKLIKTLLPKRKIFGEQLEYLIGDFNKIKGSCDSRSFHNDKGYEISVFGNSLEIKKNTSCYIVVDEYSIIFKLKKCCLGCNYGKFIYIEHGLSFDKEKKVSFRFRNTLLK